MHKPLFPDVTRAGLDVVHTADFVIDRPFGAGDYLFLCFTTPVLLRADQGIRRYPPGTCVLYPPGMPQWYSGAQAPFRHHWVHFAQTSEQIVSEAGVPVGSTFQVLDTGQISTSVAQIAKELAEQRDNWAPICGALLCVLLHWLGRQNRDAHNALDRTLRSIEKLRDIRVYVHANLHERWSVARMACMAHLSSTRFSVLYREAFGTSPIEDLLGARLQRCCWMLTNSHLGVSQIARDCGFESLTYFSRQFHKRVGCAPREYYKHRIGSAPDDSPPSQKGGRPSQAGQSAAENRVTAHRQASRPLGGAKTNG